MRRLSRQQLDEWFPTIVHYLGIVFLVVLIVATLRGGLDYPSAYIAATGMILYKYIAPSNGRNGNGNGNSHSDRWSGLP